MEEDQELIMLNQNSGSILEKTNFAKDISRRLPY